MKGVSMSNDRVNRFQKTSAKKANEQNTGKQDLPPVLPAKDQEEGLQELSDDDLENAIGGAARAIEEQAGDNGTGLL
jgi:hypothetical protein